MGPEWVVVLEATDHGAAPVGVEEVGALLEAVADICPVALYGHERYALQVTVAAAGPVEALSSAMARWAEGSARVGLPRWELVRSEVISAREHERDLKGHTSAPPASGAAAGREAGSQPEGEDLLHQALADPLTNLAEPELFCHHLAQVLAGGGDGHALLRWDLDDFGALRARLGPDGADAVVRAVAARVSAIVRPGDVVARLGPDEFALVLARTPLPAAVAVAGRLMAGLEGDLLGPGDDLSLTASMGIALSRPGEGPDAMLARAGAALAEARAAGQGTWRLSGHAATTSADGADGSSRQTIGHSG
jgi:diguanylate cyclase (GGDEF)-like protein